MSLKLIGKKKGMTHLFDEKGDLVVCTVIWAEPNVVAQIKTKEKDGSAAVQLAGVKVSPSQVKNVSKPLKGHFAKSKVEPRLCLKDSPIGDKDQYELGQEIGVDYFEGTPYVDVIGTSKGKGFQGVIKRHHFRGGPASHGASRCHRAGGSTGMRSTPGRTLPGQKMAGHMGNERVTAENLKVVKIDKEKQLIVVQGSVPGPNDGFVYIKKSLKKTKKK
ncbi:MAG TPA: 50S ribosomal protein L3 [Rhabdochlamydiaceae bacterium]|nr:50S ribosomal protein L3 [Rhabdochlamydiaceae bacterium]